MFKSLKIKIVVPVCIILIALVAAIIVYAAFAVSGLAGDLTYERVRAAATMAAARFYDIEERFLIIAEATSNNHIVTSNVLGWTLYWAENPPPEGELLNRNIAYRQAMLSYLTNLKRQLNVDGFVVRDENMNVILRTHADNFGDRETALASIAAHEQGRTSVAYASTATMPLGMSVNTPILLDGEIIGSITALYFLHTNEFVDEFARIIGAEVVVFGTPGGYTSVASTFRNAQGDRLLGTVVEVPSVLNAVLDEGRSYLTDLTIRDEPFYAYYMPLHNFAGNVIGMLFVGFSNQNTVAVANSLITTMIIFGVIGLVFAVGVMFFLIARNLKPLTVLAKTVKDVSVGNINVNINRENLPKDEIGALTQDVCGLVDVIKDMVTDLTNVHHEYVNVGNMHYVINIEKYQNSYAEMIGVVNSLLSAVTTDIEDVAKSLNHVADGNFDVAINTDAWAGDWVVMPKAVNKLTTNLQAVEVEISAMINAVSAKGDLSFHIDADKYSNDWRKVMEGLNRIAIAVDTPLKVIEVAMDEMKAGNFDMNIIDNRIRAAGLDSNSDNYKGVFSHILKSFEETISEIASYIRDIAETLSAISGGNLTTKITREYVGNFRTIKESLNNISSTLNKTMTDISVASEQVLSGTRQISTSAQDLATGAQQQASSIEELNASIDVINQQTQQNAESAAEASELSRKSTENANAGSETMKQMLDAMNQIKNSSAEISKIIKAIQDITFQTNLLSLNASVEAARAGEHGRGFAVVADEVRNLASKSQQSTVESTHLINESISRVDAGSAIAETTSESLSVIVKNANEILDIINNISNSSKEQADSISQISIGLAQISNVVQSNSAVSQQTAAASEELNSQVEILRRLVAFFKL